MAMNESSIGKYNEVQQLAQELSATVSVVQGIDSALDEISSRLLKELQRTQPPDVSSHRQSLEKGKERINEAQKTGSVDIVTKSPMLVQNTGNKAELNKPTHSSNYSSMEADAIRSPKTETNSSVGKFESIIGLLRDLDATFLASEVQRGSLNSAGIGELLPPQRLHAHSLCLNPVICNNCKEYDCCLSPIPESRDTFPKNNSPVTARSLATDRTDGPPFVECSSRTSKKFMIQKMRLKSQSMCVKMKLIPRNPSKVKTSKEQSNISTNAKQNSVRWSENTIVEESNSKYPTILNQREILPQYKYPKHKLNDERENKSDMSPNRERMPQHIRDILSELPPIYNNLQERQLDNSDLCGWLSELESMHQEGNPPGNHQVVKKTNRKVWYNPRSVKDSRECYYGVQGNHRLPYLYESVGSKFKSLPKAGVYNLSQEESAKKDSCDEETSSLDLGEDLYGSKVHSHLITLPIDSSVVAKRKRSKQPKLPLLKCTALIKASTGDPRLQWGAQYSNGVLDEIAVDSGYKRDTRRTNTPVIEILKPLPFKETKQTKQLVNWCHKNVGPIKVPALDLDFVSDSEPSTVRKEYLTGVLQRTPREHDVATATATGNKAAETDSSETEDSFSAPNVRQLLNVFNKTSHQKMDIPICLLGDKIKATPLNHPHVRLRAETPVKAYRYRGSDVPIDLVRLALRSKTINKGINNVNALLQNIPKNTCKRSSAKSTRKSLKHEEKVKVCLEKDQKIEQELSKLRKQLKENKKASRMRNGILYGLDLYKYPDTDRSGVARPSTPVTPRDSVNVGY